MKEIILKSLKLKNFKGIKELLTGFLKITNIMGENATGKTTIFDAFTWLLFDKDSQYRTDFEVKTLDSNNEVLHGLDHEVTGVLNVDGKDIVLVKVLREKWTKRKGEAERVFTGNETLYYIDEVPVKQSEYKDKVNSLIDENLFKLISNPLYFSNNMKWQDRRKVLLDIIGDISADRIINYKSDLKGLEKLLGDKDIDTFKKQIAARKKKLNDDIKSIPFRIDECNNSISKVDFDTLEFRKRTLTPAIKSIDEQIMDSSKVNDGILKEREDLYKLKSSLREIEYAADSEKNKPLQELKNSFNEISYKLKDSENKFTSLKHKKEDLLIEVENTNKTIVALRNTWNEINAGELIFVENEFVCPTCKRTFDESDIESKKQQLLENFNLNKANQLKNISASGKNATGQLEDYRTKLRAIEQEIITVIAEIEGWTERKKEFEYKINNYVPLDTLTENAEYQEIKKQIAELETKLSQPSNINSAVQELKIKKASLVNELETINKELASKDNNERMKARIKELEKEQSKLGQQIAELEGQEFLCEKFIKTKAELLESSINSKFYYVRFKLFNTLVNGAIEECCEALVNGVPYANANSAAQINAGLDIINAMSDYYQVSAPIFIDNRESVNNILDTDSQVINLIVAKLYECKDCRTVSTYENECPQCGGENLEKFNALKIESEEIQDAA